MVDDTLIFRELGEMKGSMGEFKADMRTVKHDLANVQMSLNGINDKLNNLNMKQAKGFGFFAGMSFMITVVGGLVIGAVKLFIGN